MLFDDFIQNKSIGVFLSGHPNCIDNEDEFLHVGPCNELTVHSRAVTPRSSLSLGVVSGLQNSPQLSTKIVQIRAALFRKISQLQDNISAHKRKKVQIKRRCKKLLRRISFNMNVNTQVFAIISECLNLCSL